MGLSLYNFGALRKYSTTERVDKNFGVQQNNLQRNNQAD